MTENNKGLVRYDCIPYADEECMCKEPNGDYVRYDQAAAMIAGLKAELYDMRQDRDRALEWRDHDKQRAEAAEAELAQIKAQEP